MPIARSLPTPFVLLWAVLGLMSCIASAQTRPLDFDGASWIWHSPGVEVPLGALPAAVNYFRGAVVVPDDGQVASAEVIATCDNLFVLYLNGQAVGESEAGNSAWGRPRRWDVKGLIAPGRNAVAVQAVNTLPGPAGLILKLVVRLTDGREMALTSDATWLCESREQPSWQAADFDDTHWNNARVVGQYGDRPWQRVKVPADARPSGTPIGEVAKFAQQALREAAKQQRVIEVVQHDPPAGYRWPEAIAFLSGDRSLYRPLARTNTSQDSLNVTIFNPRNSRAYPEHDLPAPMKVGRRLYALRPARPGTEPRLLLDAGRGGIGSPSVSFDGKSLLVSMAYDGEPFFHIYRVPAEGGRPERLTSGPFHDIDPAELPDGRIVFTSTRIGTFEEYHNPPSRSLFIMAADGGDVQPLTHTIIFDNEPEVLADGRIVFIRSDNFFDRGKVETLLHAIHSDGTHGYTEFGLAIGPDYGGRLRAYHCGSPAPMPDGRLAFVSAPGITIGRLGSLADDLAHYRVLAGDVAALPDARLLCSTARSYPVEVGAGGRVGTVNDLRYEKIEILDHRADPPTLTTLWDSPGAPIHSPVYLGARIRPPLMARTVDGRMAESLRPTGVLFCQNARSTQKSTAGWSHVRAIRVLAGTGLTTRSSHSYIVHAGNETIELGTVPLAPDGSFAIEVPADTPIALQAVDAEGRSELNEMSWIYVRPGERRGCVGCHHTRQAAPMPAESIPVALTTAPLRLLGRGEPHRFRGNNAAVTGLTELQLDRYREVAGINRHDGTADRTATGREEIAALVTSLREGSSDEKIAAVHRLAIFRDSAAAPALVECLDHDSREVRVAAALALATCGTRQSVPPLLAALADPDPLVAQSAAVSLENLTGHSRDFNGFAPTEQRAQDARAWSEWFAATSWGEMEQKLIARLAGADHNVARRAAVALGHTGSSAAHGALRQYVVDHRDDNPFPEWRKAGHRGDATRFNSLAPVNPRSLQAMTRALGYLKDAQSVPMLAETLAKHSDPAAANLFLAEAAVEALGRIGTAEAETALVRAFAELKDYPEYTVWYGDHTALMACHASPVHYLIIEALDSLGSRRAIEIVPHLIRSVPIDPDRALLLESDDYETLAGRVVRRAGAEGIVVETCLAALGDPAAVSDQAIQTAMGAIHRCWAGCPSVENRAAQILSSVCRDAKYEPRIRAAFERFRRQPTAIPRVFDTGIPVVDALPTERWICFYLARTLGNLGDPASVDALVAALAQSPPEAASGHPDPLGPGVLFLHNDLTPCWRAAVAWALGQIADRRAAPALLAVVGDMRNATDTRHAAANALGRIADPTTAATLEKLAESYPEISTRRALRLACEKCQARQTQVGRANRNLNIAKGEKNL